MHTSKHNVDSFFFMPINGNLLLFACHENYPQAATFKTIKTHTQSAMLVMKQTHCLVANSQAATIVIADM